ncbi:hypothetical protein [Sulfuricurvum sp.]|uniref:hypothetical protein n=1 Tax=Sulfuricurvum sp. TaxID=2025608 RepID=UPI0035673E1F
MPKDCVTNIISRDIGKSKNEKENGQCEECRKGQMCHAGQPWIEPDGVSCKANADYVLSCIKNNYCYFEKKNSWDQKHKDINWEETAVSMIAFFALSIVVFLMAVLVVTQFRF